MKDFTIVNSETDNNIFGRIATFTWPALPVKVLEQLADDLNLGTAVPTQGVNMAMFRACEVHATRFKSGHYRRFARKLRDNLVEVVQEVVIPTEDGQAKGERVTVARVVNTSGHVTVRSEHADWSTSATEEVLERAANEAATVPSGLVGNWADTVVATELGGMELANRGHSFHVAGQFADRFDRFLAAMQGASEGKDLVFVAKTVDNSPETLASLVSSMRKSLDKACEAAFDQATKATTKRGIEASARRLAAFRDQIDRYSGLFGDVAKSFVEQLEKTTGEVLAVDVLKEYGVGQ